MERGRGGEEKRGGRRKGGVGGEGKRRGEARGKGREVSRRPNQVTEIFVFAERERDETQ